ncbi:sulfurtransferase [Rhodococcus oxybenzonivorans]|uniref:sulfurtransferase n=1 Tax=Rhodococcus oxybenzonivorans TaxID=1990687 RepID=UPI00295313F4|nr:sulfurtransferase [Rhodococcus oxybenzonivorans]MDV7354495.1 sulfurtransferase [Rhodococcus oxybenzonivorans]
MVTVDELKKAMSGDAPPVLLDVRWALGDTEGRRHYLEAHVPGAVFVDLDSELAGPATPAHGRHPLPSVGALQDAARRWGVCAGSAVVAYDDTGNLAAARAWWLLRWAGLTEVALLDGGLRAWTKSGNPTRSGDENPDAPGDVVLEAGHLPTLTADEAAALAGDGVLLDARAAERYTGETEPIDPRAGHIPGAISAPTAQNLTADGRFASADVLRDRFAAVGAEQGAPVGVYCGSGVNAAHQIAALALAGVDAALYPGSWSQWSNDPDRPVATGTDR